MKRAYRDGEEEEEGRRKGEGLDEASRVAMAAKGGKEIAKTWDLRPNTKNRARVRILSPTKNTLEQRCATTMRTGHMCQHSATTSQEHGKKRGEREEGRGERETQLIAWVWRYYSLVKYLPLDVLSFVLFTPSSLDLVVNHGFLLRKIDFTITTSETVDLSLIDYTS